MSRSDTHPLRSRARVPILFTGGTISMRVDPAAGGAVPALSGRELLELAPGAAEVADLEAVEFDRVAGWRVTPDWMWKLSLAVREALADPEVAGIVVTHGTDTLEESAFLLDCVLDEERPVVFTGAMRNASEAGWDGPRNLAAAVRVAAATEARGRGVLVALNDTIFAAHGARGHFRGPGGRTDGLGGTGSGLLPSATAAAPHDSRGAAGDAGGHDRRGERRRRPARAGEPRHGSARPGRHRHRAGKRARGAGAGAGGRGGGGS